jgi:hypothetical protein
MNSGHLYKKGDCPGKHGTNGNPNLDNFKSVFFSSVQIAFNNENTEGYLEEAGLLKLTRDIRIKKGPVPGNTGRMGTLT